MSADLDPGLLQEFREEAEDHLASFEALVLGIERGEADPEVCNRMFRSAHTIKGASGFLGLAKIGSVAHAMEAVLSIVRDGKMALTKVVASTMLGGVDVLRRLLESAPDESGIDVEQIVGRLEGLLDPPTAASVMEETEEYHRLGLPGLSLRTSTYRLRHIPTSHAFQYILSYSRGDLQRHQREGKSPLALMRALQKLGMIVDDHLQANDGANSPESPAILVLFSTDLEATHIATATGLAESQILPLDLADILADLQRDNPPSLLRDQDSLPGGGTSSRPPHTPPPLARPKPKPPKPVPAPEPVVPEERAPPSAPTDQTAHSMTETVRVRVDVLDRLMRLAGELVLVRNRQLGRMEGAALPDREIAQRLDLVTAGIQDAVLSARMQPLGNVLSKFQRIVRDLGHRLGKEILFLSEGGETELDRTLLEALSDPLTHIVRNCCDHGIESPSDRVRHGKPPQGTVSVQASQEGGRVRIRIRDDGRGIDLEAVRRKALEKGLRTNEELSRLSERETVELVFLPGFSTAETVSDISGRGVGMDVVRSSIERMGGTVSMSSDPGRGTTLDLHLPLTLAIVPALVVVSGGARFAIPQANVEELVRLYDEDVLRIESAGHEDLYRLREHLLPLASLGRILSSREPFTPERRAALAELDRTIRAERLAAFRRADISGTSETFAVLSAGTGRFGLVLDRILGTEEIVVEPIHSALAGLSIYSGATILGDGEIALILDTLALCRHAGLQAAAPSASEKRTISDEALRLLLFRSGPDEQLGIPLSALKRVVRLEAGVIERSGGREYAQVDDRSVRVERLDARMGLSRSSESAGGYLLLPAGSDRSWGLLASELVDSGEFLIHSEPCTDEGPFARGTAILKGRRTILLDEAVLIAAISETA